MARRSTRLAQKEREFISIRVSQPFSHWYWLPATLMAQHADGSWRNQTGRSLESRNTPGKVAWCLASCLICAPARIYNSMIWFPPQKMRCRQKSNSFWSCWNHAGILHAWSRRRHQDHRCLLWCPRMVACRTIPHNRRILGRRETPVLFHYASGLVGVKECPPTVILLH